MNKENVVRIAKYFRATKIRIDEHNVMFNCPFAKALHKNGTDYNPSFGISIGQTSTYHCFSCGVKGRLRNLPASLFKVYGKRFKKLQHFINKYEGKVLLELRQEKDIYEVIPKNVLDAFPYPKDKWKSISLEILKMYSVREYEGTIILPFFGLDKNLYGIKYRKDRKFTTEGKYKKAGIFFGMQFGLVRNKPLFIVEGERDVMLMKQAGVSNIWGVSGEPSNAQLSAVEKVSNPVVLFLDNDESGNYFFSKLAERLKKINEVYYVKDYFGCKDPAELYEKGLLAKSLKTINLWMPQIKIFT